uniref:Aminotransferase-like plant mobile domain-containing protein n=1 Tax=Solanum lycopersicum TaxID=4081 RepID=A0A3Q7JVQ5_SOLLC
MVDEPLWMACVPMFCLEIVEVHSPDRVMRQFGHSQHVPVIPSGEPTITCMISVGGMRTRNMLPITGCSK